MKRSSFSQKPLSPRKCKQCGDVFQRRTSTQTVCSPNCAHAWTEKLKAQKEAKARAAERKSMKERAEKIKTRQEHMRELQTAFNAWVRARDAGLPCISCGRFSKGMQAGHYLSVGSHPALRCEPDNCALQCIQCNLHKHGSPISYRVNLIARIGLERVLWLEGPHDPKKYTIAEIIAMKAHYRAKVRELKKAVVNQLEEEMA